MTQNYEELNRIANGLVAIRNQVILPIISKKVGFAITNAGKDFGEIQTKADLTISDLILNKGFGGEKALRELYPGSFSEEDDTRLEERLQAKTIWQLDPMDGTGDFKKTYTSANPLGPTLLLSKLKREKIEDKFTPVSGLIFDPISGIILMSDSENIGLYRINDRDKVVEVPFEFKEIKPWNQSIIRLNQRFSYPQNVFDNDFALYLTANTYAIEKIKIGGAGRFAMQVFRNYIEPKEDNFFTRLESLDVGFNAQPDWKTWDVDANIPIITALGKRGYQVDIPTNIFGEEIIPNASEDALKKMHLTTGYVIGPNSDLKQKIIQHGAEFRAQNPNLNLLEKNY